MTAFVSNIMKVGAHLDDTQVLVDVWDPSKCPEDNVAAIIEDNLLALPSRSRAHDVVTRALRPRFIDPNGDVVPALAELRRVPDAFRDACFYELTRVDALVASFVSEQLPRWWDEGRVGIETADARAWIDKLAADELVPDWSNNIRDRVARGLLAALRDLGRLHGTRSSHKKGISRPGISLGGFAYTAFRLHQEDYSGRAILQSAVWSRWLLDPARVDEMMHLLAGRGVVYYSAVGSTIRLDWRVGSLPEGCRAVV